jgi:hypothetical protein
MFCCVLGGMFCCAAAIPAMPNANDAVSSIEATGRKTGRKLEDIFIVLLLTG